MSTKSLRATTIKLFQNKNISSATLSLFTACRCDLRGATNKTCRVRDGQCYCKRGFGGLNCGSCKKGFYGFPDCRQCECNGFSDDCDQETGVCFDCFYGRSGNHCEK